MKTRGKKRNSYLLRKVERLLNKGNPGRFRQLGTVCNADLKKTRKEESFLRKEESRRLAKDCC